MKHLLRFAIAFVLMSAPCSSSAGAQTAPVGQKLIPPSPSTPHTSEVPVQLSQPAAAQDTFIIGNDDHLMINVWNEPEISRSIPVRSDGRISLPLAGELQAAGRTPSQLEQDIAAKLLSYLTKPQVTVIVEQINSQKFNILGEVAKPGSYPLTSETTVLDAIAKAGGFRDFAKQKGVYVLRHTSNGGDLRLAFNYKEVIRGKNANQNIQVQPNDTIVVP